MGFEYEEGQLDGYWPDFMGSRRQTWIQGWNSPDVDEQGPIGIFAFTINKLQPNSHYEVEITPVFHSSINVTPHTTKLTVQTTSVGKRYSQILQNFFLKFNNWAADMK